MRRLADDRALDPALGRRRGMAPMKSRILLVARDADLRGTLARWLLAAGYAVEIAEGARRASEAAATEAVALAIVTPDVLAELGDDPAGKEGNPPGGLILVGRPAEPSAAAGIARIESPPIEDDVLARVDAALRPATAPASADPAELMRFEGYTLDAAGRTCVDAGGRDVALTRAEFTLLLTLARQAGRVVSRDALRQAVAGRDAGPDDRSVDVLISRLRRKIESDAKAPRIVITVPGEGYKFTPRPQVFAATPAVAPAPAKAAPAAPLTAAMPVPARRSFSVPLIGAIAVVLAIVVVAAIVWYPGAAKRDVAPAGPARKFDAAVIPFVDDATRKAFARYPTQPDYKALALWVNGWGIAYGAPSADAAKEEALRQCRDKAKNNRVCGTYSVGMDVVWPSTSPPMPLPSDLHVEPLDLPFVAAEFAPLDAETRKGTDGYVRIGEHKGLAVTSTGHTWSSYRKTTPAEAARVTVEKCGEAFGTACLLVSIDNKLTVEIPKSRTVTAFFMVTTELGLSDAERAQIDRVYRGKDWRALARGASGGWYPVADADSEAAAIEAALAACAQRDSGCRVYAIGNFRVADR